MSLISLVFRLKSFFTVFSKLSNFLSSINERVTKDWFIEDVKSFRMLTTIIIRDCQLAINFARNLRGDCPVTHVWSQAVWRDSGKTAAWWNEFRKQDHVKGSRQQSVVFTDFLNIMSCGATSCLWVTGWESAQQSCHRLQFRCKFRLD